MEKTKVLNNLRNLERLNKQSPMGNFFQSPEFYHVLKQANQKPFVLTVVECAREKKCLAGLLGYNKRQVLSVMKFFPDLIVTCGPILAKDANSNAIDTLLRNLDSEARTRGVLRVEMKMPFPPWALRVRALDEIFYRNGYTRFDTGYEYSVIIDLAKDENTLWKEVKRKARRDIKKAIQRNVEIKEVVNEQELRSFYQIYLNTAQRRNFIPYSYSFFQALKSIQPTGITKFFLAWHDKRPIAGILNVVYNGQASPFVAGSLEDYWKVYPNHLLFWHSICWSKTEAKARTFKMEYVTKSRPKSGIDYYSFKTSFGGDLIRECYGYYKVVSPLKLQLLEKGSRLLRVGNVAHARDKFYERFKMVATK